MCRLSWNLGASTCWNPQGLSRPAMTLLYLYLYKRFCDPIVLVSQITLYLHFSFITINVSTPPTALDLITLPIWGKALHSVNSSQICKFVFFMLTFFWKFEPCYNLRWIAVSPLEIQNFWDPLYPLLTGNFEMIRSENHLNCYNGTSIRKWKYPFLF
jgi:hypothetical protein